MNTITIDFHDKHGILSLNRPKANAINMEMVGELRETFNKLNDSETVEGVILTGTGSIFSAGLDVVELYGYDEDAMNSFWLEFSRLWRDMISFPKPLICAVNGASPAGGCVLSLCCDYRVMTRGKHTIGLNEIPVGIVVPHPLVEVVRATMGDVKTSRMFYNGLLMNADQAFELGLVDEVCEQDEILKNAEAQLLTWMNMPKVPWQTMKKTIRGPILEMLSNIDFEDAFGPTLQAWWSTENRKQVGNLVAKLTGKAS
jgi:enoyl-CoA hydratase/carnithine racemase